MPISLIPKTCRFVSDVQACHCALPPEYSCHCTVFEFLWELHEAPPAHVDSLRPHALWTCAQNIPVGIMSTCGNYTRHHYSPCGQLRIRISTHVDWPWCCCSLKLMHVHPSCKWAACSAWNTCSVLNIYYYSHLLGLVPWSVSQSDIVMPHSLASPTVTQS